MGNTRRP